MSAVRLLPYGTAATINFHLYATDGTVLKTDAAHASGDTTLMKDEGSEANTTNGFTDEGKGYSIALTAAELTAARVVLYVVDQGTQAWLDEVVTIETYGHPSSQHPSMGIPVVDTGLITAATSTTADLGTSAPTTDDLINASLIYIQAGTGAGQTRTILDYDQANDRVTVQAWAVTPSTDSVYQILPAPPADTGANAPEVQVGAILTAALADLFAEDSGTTYGSAVAGSVVKEIADNAGGSALTEAGIADAVWDEAQSGHTTGGTFGELATEIAAVKAKTDSLTFTVSNQVDANNKSTNDITITGAGTAGDPWGP